VQRSKISRFYRAAQNMLPGVGSLKTGCAGEPAHNGTICGASNFGNFARAWQNHDPIEPSHQNSYTGDHGKPIANIMLHRNKK
jgi:hypothetical protein